MSKTSVKPRKVPTQKRSKETVDRIMDSALLLLEEDGIEGLTAIKVSKKAGVNIASFYQYFPNKNAVVYAVFQSWLDWVMTVFDATEKSCFQKVPWRDFFYQLGNDIFRGSFISDKAAIELLRLMEVIPELKKRNEKHGEMIVKRLTGYLKGYGSRWDDEKLQELGMCLFTSGNSLFRNAAEQSPARKKIFMAWSADMLLMLIGKCFKREL